EVLDKSLLFERHNNEGLQEAGGFGLTHRVPDERPAAQRQHLLWGDPRHGAQPPPEAGGRNHNVHDSASLARHTNRISVDNVTLGENDKPRAICSAPSNNVFACPEPGDWVGRDLAPSFELRGPDS